MLGTVYKITNSVNGKSYVGITTRSHLRRFYEHKWNAARISDRGNVAIYRAIRKYGEDSFSIEVLERCDKEKLNDREEYWIEKLGTLSRGYNMTKGGDCLIPGESHISYGRPKTEDHKRKISEAHLGKRKPGNSGVKSRDFSPWSYVDSLGNYHECFDISKTDWCKKNGTGTWLIKENIRLGKPVCKGRFRGYQFFNKTGGGLTESIGRAVKKNKDGGQ